MASSTLDKIKRSAMIKVVQTTLPGVLKIKRKVSEDHRGVYVKIYSQEEYLAAGIPIDFSKGEQDHSTSDRDVFRGLHGDIFTYKLVCCTAGELWLYVVNYEKDSKFFGKWEVFKLTHRNGLQILVPPVYLNGHLIRSEIGTFHYNQSVLYSGAKNQWSVKWNDTRFGITLPIDNPILSERDGGNLIGTI